MTMKHEFASKFRRTIAQNARPVDRIVPIAGLIKVATAVIVIVAVAIIIIIPTIIIVTATTTTITIDPKTLLNLKGIHVLMIGVVAGPHLTFHDGPNVRLM